MAAKSGQGEDRVAGSRNALAGDCSRKRHAERGATSPPDANEGFNAPAFFLSAKVFPDHDLVGRSELERGAQGSLHPCPGLFARGALPGGLVRRGA